MQPIYATRNLHMLTYEICMLQKSMLTGELSMMIRERNVSTRNLYMSTFT